MALPAPTWRAPGRDSAYVSTFLSCPEPCADVCLQRDGRIPARLGPFSLDGIFVFSLESCCEFYSLNLYYHVKILSPILLRKQRQLEENFCKLIPSHTRLLCPLYILLCLLLPQRNGPCSSPGSTPPLAERHCSRDSPLSGIFPLLA